MDYQPLGDEASPAKITKAENSYEKSEYDEEVKLLKKMFQLLAKYDALKLDKNDKSIKNKDTEKKNNEYNFPVSFSHVRERQKDNFQIDKSPAKTNKQTNAENFEQPNLTPANSILNNKEEEDTTFAKQPKLLKSSKSTPTISHSATMLNNQTTADLATSMVNVYTMKDTNVSQATLHQTKLTNKDGTLEILNKLPINDISNIEKPKVIHSKAEAIGEIFKALGGNNRIVKDANGLYLISGKHVKIIHRTHGIQPRERNFENIKDKEMESSRKATDETGPLKRQGKVEDMINPSEPGLKTSQASLVRGEKLQLPNKAVHRGHKILEESKKDRVKSKLGLSETKSRKNSGPASLVNSTNSAKTQQGSSHNVLNDMKKKFGLDLSNYNLNDFKYKLQSKSKSVNSDKFKSTEDYEQGETRHGKSNKVNTSKNRMFPKKKNLKSRNKQKTHLKLNGDSFANSTVPHEVNNKILPSKEKENPLTNDENRNEKEIRINHAYINSAVPNKVKNTMLPQKENEMHNTNMENRNEKQIQEKLNDAYSNSTQPLHVVGKSPSKNEHSPEAAETDENSNPLNFTSTFMKVSNESNVSPHSLNKNPPNDLRSASKPSLSRFLSNARHPHRLSPKHDFFSQDDQVNSSSGYKIDSRFQHKSRVTDEKPRDVHIEVIDEAKPKANKGQTSTKIKQDLENVEIFDEGASSQPPVKITPEDISSALHDRFGKNTHEVHFHHKWPWKARKGTKLPDTTKASKSHQSAMKMHGIGFDNNSESKSSTTSGGSKEATGNDQSKSEMSLDATQGKTLEKVHISKARKVTKEPSHSKSIQSNTANLLGRNTGNGQPTHGLRDSDHRLSTSRQKMDSNGIHSGTNVKQSNNDNSVGINRANEGSHRTSMNHKEASMIINGSGEPMIPKSIVDAMLLSLTQKLKERNSQINQMNSQEKHTTKNLKPHTHFKSTKKAMEHDMITEHNNHKPTISQQEVAPSKISQRKPTSAENANLDNLLEKFVRLLSRHMKATKTEKPKTKLKSHHKHNTLSTTPFLRDQEKLLWREQRKLEHKLRAEEKLLEKSKLNENLQLSPTNIEANIKKKIHELNEEENFLLEKLRMLSFQGQHETETHEVNNKLMIPNLMLSVQGKHETETNDVNNDKLMIPNQEEDFTGVYGEPNQKSVRLPYMDSHVTYNAVGDRDSRKEHGSDYELERANEELNHLLAKYEAAIRSSNSKTTSAYEQSDRAPSNSETHLILGEHELQEPDTTAGHDEHSMVNKKHDMVGWEKFMGRSESNANTHDLNKVTSNIRDFDNMPRYTADQMPDDKSFTAGASEDGPHPHVPTEYTIHQHTSEYIHMDPHETNNVPYLHTSNHISSTPNYPAPSFINKEADYASDTAEKLEDPFMERKSNADSTLKHLHQRTIKKKSDFNDFLQSLNEDGKGRQGIQGVHNVFPGTVSYDEGQESTREDANLLKEMPEYSEKANTIESEKEPRHYAVLTIEKDPAAEVKPQDTNIPDLDSEIKQQITNTVDSDSEEKIGPAGSQSSDVFRSDMNRVRHFRPNAEEANQPNLREAIHSQLYPQTSDIASSNNKVAREPGNELRNSFREESIRYENTGSQKPKMNQIGDIHSFVPGHFSTLTSQKESDELTSRVTTTADSESDDDDEEGSRGTLEDSSRPTGPEIDGAFDVVQGGEVPTLRRNTDNPEVGVQDKTFINGDEYHLQKKYGIAKKDMMKHKSSVHNTHHHK